MRRPSPRFWMGTASVVFFIVMAVVFSVPSDEDHIGPFGAGFLTAVLLVVAWTVFGERQNPKWTARLKGQIFDLDSGQIVDRQVFPVDGKLPWVACVRSLRTDRIKKLEVEAHFPEDDLYYDGDVHLLPYRDGDPWHGIHEFSRSCSCRPEIMEQYKERTLVIHVERG